MSDDHDLIREYRENASQRAFEAIVERYVDLVYSVAHRQLEDDAHLASDVCQEVFFLFARKPTALRPEVSVSGWLYQCALYTAKRFRRRERRRRKREEAAAMEAETARSGELDWEPIRPLLDWTMGKLNDDDRNVISLRFLEGRSYAEIAGRLRSSEDAARMRTNRALEKLRRLLASKGVRSTAAALGGALGAQAALAAPAQLSGSICQFVATGLAAGTGSSTIGIVIGFMNTSKGTATLALAAAAIAAGVAVFQNQKLDAAQSDLALLESQLRAASMSETSLADLRARLSELDTQLASLRQPESVAPPLLRFEVEDFEEELADWAQRMERVARYLEINDAYWIPELDLLSPENWLQETKDGALESEADFRRVLGRLRFRAKNIVISGKIHPAVRAYVKAHEGRFPKDPAELISHIDHPFDARILTRFQYRAAGDSEFADFAKGAEAMVESVSLDPIWDTQFCLTEKGFSIHNLPGMFELDHVAEAAKRFEEANGQEPKTADELLPYLSESKDHQLISEIFDAMQRKPSLVEGDGAP